MIQQKLSIYIYRNTVARKCPTVYKLTPSTVKLTLSIDAFQQPKTNSNSQWQYTWQMTSFLIVSS